MEQLPCLTPEDFDGACDELLTSIQKIDRATPAVRTRHEDGQRYLVLKRPLHAQRSEARDMEYHEADEQEETLNKALEDEEINEVDEAALHRNRSVGRPAAVEYSILLSATYQVPVLYFGLCDLPLGGPSGIDAAYECLVPEQWRSGLSSLGVMGAISMANHPITDVPCFFIHPCNTAEAMKELLQSRQVSGLEYLQLWVGLVGGCVGLYLPKELAFGS